MDSIYMLLSTIRGHIFCSQCIRSNKMSFSVIASETINFMAVSSSVFGEISITPAAIVNRCGEFDLQSKANEYYPLNSNTVPLNIWVPIYRLQHVIKAIPWFTRNYTKIYRVKCVQSTVFVLSWGTSVALTYI